MKPSRLALGGAVFVGAALACWQAAPVLGGLILGAIYFPDLTRSVLNPPGSPEDPQWASEVARSCSRSVEPVDCANWLRKTERSAEALITSRPPVRLNVPGAAGGNPPPAAQVSVQALKRYEQASWCLSYALSALHPGQKRSAYAAPADPGHEHDMDAALEKGVIDAQIPGLLPAQEAASGWAPTAGLDVSAQDCTPRAAKGRATPAPAGKQHQEP